MKTNRKHSGTACRWLAALSAFLPLVGLGWAVAACTADDDAPQVTRLTQTTTNPMVYLYVEDAEGHDLLAGGAAVSAVCEETGQALDHHTVAAAEAPLPWGGRGTLLAVAPAEPYHALYDSENVYTLNPTSLVTVGDATPIRLQRTFDYDLHRTGKGKNSVDVDVSYTPLYTLLCGVPVTADTLHIVMESGYPYLRIDGEELTLEMRFPAMADSLAALPCLKSSDADADEGRWAMGDVLRARLLYSGLTIARPIEVVSAGNCTETATGADGQTSADSYFAVRARFRLPYVYSQGSYGYIQFSFRFLVESPLLFGDSGEHELSVDLYRSPNEALHLTEAHFDWVWVNPDRLSLPCIVYDWRYRTTEPDNNDDDDDEKEE